MEVKDRKDIDVKDTWNLESIYANNELWEEEYAALEKEAEEFAKLKGAIEADVSKIPAVLDAYYGLHRRLSKLSVYARMRFDQDTTDSTYQTMSAKIGSLGVKIGAASAFVEPEILSYSKEQLEAAEKEKGGEPPLNRSRLFLGGSFFFDKVVHDLNRTFPSTDHVRGSDVLSVDGVGGRTVDFIGLPSFESAVIFDFGRERVGVLEELFFVQAVLCKEIRDAVEVGEFFSFLDDGIKQHLMVGMQFVHCFQGVVSLSEVEALWSPGNRNLTENDVIRELFAPRQDIFLIGIAVRAGVSEES